MWCVCVSVLDGRFCIDVLFGSVCVHVSVHGGWWRTPTAPHMCGVFRGHRTKQQREINPDQLDSFKLPGSSVCDSNEPTRIRSNHPLQDYLNVWQLFPLWTQGVGPGYKLFSCVFEDICVFIYSLCLCVM